MERRTPFLLLLLAWLLAIPAAAMAAGDTTRTYDGSIGPAPVVMELATNAQGQVTGGRYFYTRHHLDLMLEADHPAARHVALAEGADKGKARPVITLEPTGTGAWTGSWRSPAGRTLPVKLVPVVPAGPPDDAPDYLRRLSRASPYDYRRLAGLPLTAGKREVFMGHTLQWREEPVSGIRLFTIIDGYDAAQRTRINRVLTDRLWDEVNSWFACKDNHFGEGDYEQTVTPRLLTPDLVSISVFTNYFCGGAHPDFGDAPINLDAHTAKPLALEDLLWVGKGAPLRYVEGADDGQARDPASFEAWADYRGHQLAPWLVAQWQTLYPDDMKPDGEDDCDYANPDVWQFVSWHMTPKGIFLGPSFARVARACEANDDWSVLPWRIVHQHPGRLGHSR